MALGTARMALWPVGCKYMCTMSHWSLCTLVEGGNTSGTQHTTRMLRSSAAQPMEDQNKGLGGIHQQAVVLLSGGDMDAS